MTDQNLARALDTTLSDGTRIEDLFDLDRHEVAMRVLSDPEIYRLEQDRLWNRSWLALAHESEIPQPGDFVTRRLGTDPAIVIRGDDGTIDVLLNVCQHRGMEVCRTDAGNARTFRCVYHGWAYGRDGRFLGAPVAAERMHGDVYEKSELGLPKARVELFGGFVFANWDRDAPGLDEFLGDMKWYYELIWEKAAAGLEVLGPPQRFVVPGNWKAAGEQAAGDGYHTLTMHRSLFEMAMPGADSETVMAAASQAMYGVDIGTPQGHGIRCIPTNPLYYRLVGVDPAEVAAMTPMERMRRLPPTGLVTPEMVEDLQNRFDEERLRVLADYEPQVGGLFPNLLNAFVRQPDMVDGTPTISHSLSVHVYLPLGPDRMEFLNWNLVQRGTPPELRERMLRKNVFYLGTSGTIEQDDAEGWPSMTRAAQGGMGRRQTMKYQALQKENKPDWWPGGGLVSEGFTKDDGQWNWWLRYRDYMLGKAI